MNTVPRPGQMGFHNRVQSGYKFLKFMPCDQINPKAGWEGYGNVKNKVVLVSGSIPGHIKRLVAFRFAERKPKNIKLDISEITNIVY
jgi:large subunit ribosomal protein L3